MSFQAGKLLGWRYNSECIVMSVWRARLDLLTHSTPFPSSCMQVAAYLTR
jgi:hypothetical protein